MCYDCSFLKRIWLLLKHTYKRKNVAKATFFIRQEQSLYMARRLVINSHRRHEQGFPWHSIWCQKWSLPACAVLLLKTTTFQPLKESTCTHLCHFPGHSDPALPTVLNSANRFPIQVIMDHMHSCNFSQHGKFWPRANDTQQEKQQHCYDTSHLLCEYESNLKGC